MLTLNFLAAREHNRDLRRAAENARVEAGTSPVTRVSLRYAAAADADRLQLLAELDSAHTPAGPALVAEVDGRVLAAFPLDGGVPISDPFHRGAELIELLRMRASQIGRGAPRRAQRA
jgi:hypothetical protein